MNSANLERSLIAKANRIGQRRVQNIQRKLAIVLQEAAPDGAISQDENGVHIAARRLFDRMMTNEKLRSPQSFLEGFLGRSRIGQNPTDGGL